MIIHSKVLPFPNRSSTILCWKLSIVLLAISAMKSLEVGFILRWANLHVDTIGATIDYLKESITR